MKEYVSSFRGEFGHLFPGSGASGGGAGGSGGSGVAGGGAPRTIRNSDIAGKAKYLKEIAAGTVKVVDG